MNISSHTPSEPAPPLPFCNPKDVMPLRAEFLDSQPATWPNFGLDGWEDDGGSVAKVGAAWPTFNLYG